MESQDLLEGTVGERYRIEREIGSGGMAVLPRPRSGVNPRTGLNVME